MLVAVQLLVFGLYLPPVFRSVAVLTAPHDHFTAGPNCRVICSGRGAVTGARGCPAIRIWIVSPAGIETVTVFITSTPHNHFTAGPHGCMHNSGRQARCARSGPAIGARIVSSAGV